jgi:hypothetical protein
MLVEEKSVVSNLEKIKECSQGYFNLNPEQWPRKVFVRFKLNSIREISDSNSNVSMEVCVYLRWFDPGIIDIHESAGFKRTVAEYEQLWAPKIEINGAESVETLWDGNTSWNLKDYKTGEVNFPKNTASLQNFIIIYPHFHLIANQLSLALVQHILRKIGLN